MLETETMLTENHILAALADCYDPEIPLNIVELGLVERIVLVPDPDAPGAGIAGVPDRYTVAVTLIPSTHHDDATAQLKAQIANRLAGLPELSRVTVTLAGEPAWTPARITPAGRRTLGRDRPQFPILNNKVRSL